MSDTIQAPSAPTAAAPEQAEREKPRGPAYWRLGTFVAWSLIAHLSAGVAWGVPALLKAQAERALEQQKKEDAARIAKGAVEAKAHAKEQMVEVTNKQVQEQLKNQVEKLTAAMTDAQRDKLWDELKDKLADNTHAYAEALGNPEISEQDLRNLEAQLQQELIKQLDAQLDTANSKDMADNFLAQVETQVAPDLAQHMQDDVRDRVAKQLRDQADKLIAAQRDAAKRQREAGTNALREAQRQIAAADELAKKDTQDAKRSAQNLKSAADKLSAATKQVAAATERTPDLGTAAKDSLTAADTAVKASQDTLASTTKTVADSAASADAKTASREQLTAALEAAKKAADAALETIAKADAREEEVREQLKKTSEQALKTAAEQAFSEQFQKETVPRLSTKLAQAFQEQLKRSGIEDPKLVAEVTAKASELLATKVPELAKAGEQVQAKFSDVASAAGAEAGQAEQPSQPPLQLTELDKKLAAGEAQLIADTKNKVGAIAKDGKHDGSALKKVDGSGTGDAAGLDMRERIGRMAEGMANGRMGSLGESGMSGLRQGALARGLLARDNRPEDLEAYKKAAAVIADRGAQQGAEWARSGAVGNASDIVASTELVPARAAGVDNTGATATVANAAPYQPSFKSLAFAAVPNLPGTFVLDGRPEKWANIPSLPLNPEYGGDRSPQGMQLGWRADGLYGRFTVIDPNRTMNKTHLQDFWQGDTVELWIDCLNSKERFRARHAGQQFWIWPEGSLDDASLTGGESVVEKKGGWYVPRPFHDTEMQRITTRTADGYIMEFRLPAERLLDADFAPGRIIGLNAYVSTKSGTDWYWSAGKTAGTYAQPDTWGDLLLSGSDAKIELADQPAGKPALIIPGQALRLKITDGDMDLSSTVRDKIMVTLKPAHGGQQLMICEETGPATGVFTGAISTALSVGDDQPGTLGVYEGESVDAVYLDQARANGARNADVHLSLRFGSALLVALPKK
jgi:hypothetical protein